MPFVGLPGNPVAAMVTFVRIARPLILRLAGGTEVTPNLYRVRARLVTRGDGSLVAERFPREGAGILSSLVGADGLVELPEGVTQLTRGTMVDFLPFSEVCG